MKTKVKFSLLPRIIVAIVLGVLFGHFLPQSVVRLFVTFNGLFSQFLNFAIPLIILALVAVAIADIGKGAGKMLFFVTVLAYVTTLISGFFSYGVSQTFFPSIIESAVALNTTDLTPDLTPYFSVAIPPLMDVMTALFLSFLLGLGMASIAGEQMKSLFYEFQQVVVLTIKSVIIPLLPLYIMGIFMNMTATGQVYRVLTVFAGIIAIIFVMHIAVLLFQYSVAGIIARKNPLVLLKNMLPAYFTALGTQSSAATIPVTLAQTKKNGVTPEIADFVIPLCATIHLSGSTLKIVACALALMLMKEIPY
ncbi:MAG: cation:dicarboxylase symporter family transporter, partial [Bacteroidales bacterium]|nr:cation:dicarboxylase symporter family transporter [Bacteroidales bacterium]